MNAVVEHSGAPTAPAPTMSDNALISVIERAANNPAIDIEKMERLLAMHTAIRREQAEAAFNDAMCAAQAA